MVAAPRKKKRKRRKLTPEERSNRKFWSDIRTVFTNAGFEHIPTRHLELTVNGRKGDLDNLFKYQNLLVLLEDTTDKQPKLHLLKTASFFSHLAKHKTDTLAELDRISERFREARASDGFDDAEYRWVFAYCPRKHLDSKYEDRHPEIRFFRFSSLQYFLSIAKIIQGSVRSELLRFLQVPIEDVGSRKSRVDKRVYDSIQLSESPSGFPPGHRVVTFLMDPETLLEQCYVLRKDGWEDPSCLYQRLLSRAKIKEMRNYLATEGRVFVNNIIATLPSETRFLDSDGNPFRMEDLDKMGMGVVGVEIPRSFGSIGIVDGQHRAFAYHVGFDTLDSAIGVLRRKQHLLVTGIVYPPVFTALQKRQFEAKLFLEINDKQTKAKSALKQDIQTITQPFSNLAIAKRVMNQLSVGGPLSGHMEQHFFDRGKVKTASIVSYGLRPLVAIDGENSLYQVWNRAGKAKLKDKEDLSLLEDYIRFCSNHLSGFISGLKRHLPHDMWTPDRKISRALTTTSINGLIFCLRLAIEDGKTASAGSYAVSFSKCQVDFHPERFMYRSSHWRNLGYKLYEQCFN